MRRPALAGGVRDCSSLEMHYSSGSMYLEPVEIGLEHLELRPSSKMAHLIGREVFGLVEEAVEWGERLRYDSLEVASFALRQR